MKSENNSSEVKAERTESKPEVRYEFSKVAANPKQSIVVLVAVCAIFGYIFFNLFIKSKEDKKQEIKTAATPKGVVKPVSGEAIDNGPPIPQLPQLPKLVAPKDVPPPPAPQEEKKTASITAADNNLNKNLPLPPPPPLIKQEKEPQAPSLPKSIEPVIPLQINNGEDAQKRRETKRKSNMVLIAGNPNQKTPAQIQQENDFVRRGEMSLVLGRGKVIDAVLETAINTDTGGEVRALVSRDVYSEQGRAILIPKGSRVFGRYATSIENSGAYGRVNIKWFRVDLSNGYTMNITAVDDNSIDSLGRTGIQGRVDNKFQEQMTNAVLMSAFNIATAKGLDVLVPPPPQSSTATANQAVATSLQNVLSTSAASKAPAAQQVNSICSQSLASITDKTSAAYTALSQACSNINSQAATDDQKLASITSSVNSAINSLLTTSAANLSPTQVQEASKQAFTDLTNQMKNMINQNIFKPTVTVNQGTLVKIYVNKDYIFPRDAVQKTRMIK